jgi:hypothetical protein
MRRSTTSLLAVAMLSLLARAAIAAPAEAQSPQAACERLAGLTIPAEAIALPTGGAAVTAATLVPASARPGLALPEYCKVLASVRPVDALAPPIRFELDLPTAWNRKVVMFGGGGFDGEIPITSGNVPAGPAAGPVPLARGYAVFGSDSGHQAKEQGLAGQLDASFALNAEALRNYSGDALKKTRDAAVYVVRARYGVERPDRAYFAGGSTGGREALEAILRWPGDWDGAISLYPAWNAITLDLQVGRIARALARPGGYLNQAKRELLYEASLAACDALDGAVDGIVSNVAACNSRFDPATAVWKGRPLRCPGGGDAGDDCLSDAQLATLHAYSTPIVLPAPLASGETQYPGYNIYGADLGRATKKPFQEFVTLLALGSEAPTRPLPPHAPSLNLFWDQWTRFFFARDASYDALTLDPRHLGRLRPRIDALSVLLDVNRTDLSAFASRGGKLLIAHGTADVLVSTRSTEQYFQRLVSTMGAAKVRDFARFYEIPGYGHAVSTVFNAAWDSLTALENWVEKGIAPPPQIIADTIGSPGRTRPLCEYPSWPKYRGYGDVNVASSFVCTPQGAP